MGPKTTVILLLLQALFATSNGKPTFPWLVILRNETKKCLGTLIKPDFVLTSALCAWNEITLRSTFAYVVGTFKNEKDMPKKALKTSFIHPCYFGIDNYTFRYGIGLYELQSPFQLGATVQVIKLDPFTGLSEWDYSPLEMVGWELYKSTYSIRYSKQIIEFSNEGIVWANGKVVSSSALVYDKSMAEMSFANDSWWFRIAGIDRTGVCLGGSGSPLLYRNTSSEYIQIGVAWQHEFEFSYYTVQTVCHSPEQLSTFVRLDKHVNWINAVVQAKQGIEVKCEGRRETTTMTTTTTEQPKQPICSRVTTTSKAKDNLKDYSNYISSVFLLMSLIARIVSGGIF